MQKKRETLTLKSLSDLPKTIAEPNGNVVDTEFQQRYHPRAHTVATDKREDKKPFVVHNGASLKALGYWLQDKKYNTFIESTDKNGNTIFGIAWDFDLGRFPSYKRSKRGVITILEQQFVAKAGEITASGMKPDNEMGVMERKAKIDLYKYGRE